MWSGWIEKRNPQNQPNPIHRKLLTIKNATFTVFVVMDKYSVIELFPAVIGKVEVLVPFLFCEVRSKNSNEFGLKRS